MELMHIQDNYLHNKIPLNILIQQLQLLVLEDTVLSKHTSKLPPFLHFGKTTIVKEIESIDKVLNPVKNT
jgi:hypothetical protein